MNNKIKNIAIIGYGNIAIKHFKILKKILPKSNFFVISKRSIKTDMKNIIFFNKLNDLKNISIDLALICTPAVNHYKDFLFFYKKKSNILIEKPLSKNILEAKKILQYSKNYRNVIESGYVLRHSSSGKKMKELLRKKIVGDIIDVQVCCDSFLPNWRPNRNYLHTVSANRKLGGGVLLELSHELDYISWLFGNLTKVFATFSPNKMLKTNVEEAVNIIFLQKKYIINARVNFNQKFLKKRYCIVSGTKGLLKWDIIKNKVELINSKNKKKTFKFYDNAFKSQLVFLVNQINKIKKKRRQTNSLSQALTVLKIISYIKISNKQKKYINIK
jgi:predicted dehydrogenase